MVWKDRLNHAHSALCPCEGAMKLLRELENLRPETARYTRQCFEPSRPKQGFLT